MIKIKNTQKLATITAESGHSFEPGKEVTVSPATYTRLQADQYIANQIRQGNLVVDISEDFPEGASSTEQVTREWLAQAPRKQILPVLNAHFEDGDTPEYPKNIDDLREFAAGVLFVDG